MKQLNKLFPEIEVGDRIKTIYNFFEYGEVLEIKNNKFHIKSPFCNGWINFRDEVLFGTLIKKKI